ncbi:efflux RND transporter periplasmic adaptor subunit [Bradyrhizobium sp.]|nr:efflux RND transporter periplasmic adaptor subunit [Bradyrhizobium sp.]MDU1495747.1 efflux RND transporter periplasmic adaptor subunit [Bradyrhizobium sp.]MDU1545898.1 efflux RND transporter periplasmic adaptor subunit [Bradyrhizobium sp.]MDU1806632.1 efflux RND transporter periplasmic adaptor subunit [Bradyrhizobium sp.]MDU3041842.1 efflux RND transporter periplasmic adaptor subunit [Bradyrhizobium sp.]MDU3093140.1 efflux RND transporter periplasmic adaptor subunit [Bradyrhizobium sp.]
MFAVSGARRQQVEAAAAQISDPRRDAGERSGAAPIATTLARAERHSITETLAVTGSLVAREENVVGAEVDGLRIVELLADVGDRVEAGQVLARLDGTMLRTQLAQNTAMIAIAQASVAQMQASMAEMQANEAEAADALNRTLTLNSTGTISPAQLLARETQAKVAAAKSTAAAENLRMAKAEEAFAEAQRGEIELKIARTELKAPTAGIISHRAARLGAVTGTAGEPLFRLIRNGQIEFDAEVPETVLPQIEPAQDVEVWLPGVSQSIRGHVRLVDPIVDKASRLGRVAVALSPHAAMRAGVFARGSITLGKRQAVTVPLSAVSFSKNGSYVQLATNNVVELRNVQTGLARGTRVEIVSGLIEGQEVVVRAAAFVRPGDRILPVRSDAGSAGED